MSQVWLGIILAITASASNNFGIVLQKKAINTLSPEAREGKFFRTLLRSPVWLLGIFFQMTISTVCLLTAHNFIGPTLVPGLQGIGLVVLVLGSVWLNKESLALPEYIGIALLIIATTLIGFSELHIEVSVFDFRQMWFFRNMVVYSVILIGFCLLFEIGQRNSTAFRKGLLLSIFSGFSYAITDFWTSPLVGTIGKVFKLQANWTEWALFLIACVLLVSSNFLAITKTQTAFKYGPASILIPIRHVPTLTSPVLVYHFIYNMTAPESYSLLFFLVSIVLIFVGATLLGRREARFADEETPAIKA